MEKIVEKEVIITDNKVLNKVLKESKEKDNEISELKLVIIALNEKLKVKGRDIYGDE